MELFELWLLRSRQVGLTTGDIAFDGQPYGLLGEDGLLTAPVQRLTERGAMQHGSTDVGYLLQPRSVQLAVGIFFDDATSFWYGRQQLIEMLSPDNQPALLFLLGNGSYRQLDVELVGTMSGGSTDRHGYSQSVGLSLVAANPSFYDPTAVTVNFAVGGGSGAFEVPLEVPLGVGASEINQTQSVLYGGSWYSYPVLRIVGPITDVQIINESTGARLDFDGTTIAAGDMYVIDTAYGRKSVRDAAGDNKLADLSADSDLGAFFLRPGLNSLRVIGSSAAAATAVSVTFYKRYLGI